MLTVQVNQQNLPILSATLLHSSAVGFPSCILNTVGGFLSRLSKKKRGKNTTDPGRIQLSKLEVVVRRKNLVVYSHSQHMLVCLSTG